MTTIQAVERIGTGRRAMYRIAHPDPWAVLRHYPTLAAALAAGESRAHLYRICTRFDRAWGVSDHPHIGGHDNPELWQFLCK